MPVVTKLFRVVTCCEVLSPKYAWHLNRVVLRVHMTNKIYSQPAQDVSTPHVARCWLSVRGSPLIKWPTWGLFKESIFSIFTRFIAYKIERLLTLGRIFSVQINTWFQHKWNIGSKWVKGLMRQRKYSVGLTIQRWGGVRGHGKVFKFLTK